MIIFNSLRGVPVALRASNIMAVEQHPEDAGVSVITHTLNKMSKKTNTLFVKHTVQEVVDALSKTENWY